MNPTILLSISSCEIYNYLSVLYHQCLNESLGMVTSTTLYRVMCELNHDELVDRFSNMNFPIASSRGTILHTRCYNTHTIDNNCSIFSIEYQEEEGPFNIDGQEQFFAVSQYTKFALIDSQTIVAFCNKKISNNLMNKVNNYLFDRTPVIFDSSFSEQYIQAFLNRNPHVSGNAFMGELTNPGANNAAIYGSDVEESDMFRHAQEYGGKYKYVRIRLTQLRKTIGISRKGILVFFTRCDEEEMLQFIRQYILV